jgi:hypothetical protein
MHPCPTCACHVRASDRACPHCGAAIGARRAPLSAAAAVLGLAMACTGPGKTEDSGTPTYGVDYGSSPTDITDTTDITDADADADADSDADADADTDTDADADADADADSDADTDTGPTTGVDYGVAPTGSTGDTGGGTTVEPEYGVSTTGSN